MRNLAIIGSGPAGYTAAIYAARADLAPMLLTGEEMGGQLTTTTEVENYPGFPEGIPGPDLMQAMEQQATRFGTEVKMACIVDKVEVIDGGFRLTWRDLYSTSGEDESAEFKAVIIATGASARYLGLPGEEEFLDGSGKKMGLTGCAVCDGAMPLYRDKPVCVIGGGDSACEEALFMTKYASQVYLIHRRDELRASKIMGDRVQEHDKVEVLWCKVPTGYHTDEGGKMSGVTLKDTKTDEESVLEVNGVFMGIGHKPNTGFLQGSDVDLDKAGYIVVSDGCKTSVPGLFAAGDVRDTVYRQAVTAAGMGCMAALEAEKFLES